MERHGRFAALAVVALGFTLRLRGLSAHWLNPDEGIYYSTLTRASTGEFWAEVMANAHPPLFYLILRAVGVFTWDFAWLRGVSLVCGTVAIWVLWLLGREMGGKGWGGVASGLLAASLLALSGEAIVLSQVLRPYMLLVALSGAALYHLLSYRSEPTSRHLVSYAAYASLALLTHYGAALAFGVFLALVAYTYVAEPAKRPEWERLALAQAVPAVVLVGLYLTHLDWAMNSYMMYLALAPDGWLSAWLVASPGDAWRSFATLQTFTVPVSVQARAALLVLMAVVGAAFTRDRVVAVVAGGALALALLASVAGLYPFGPTRHNAWLVVFTLPALGWLLGRVVDGGKTAALLAGGALLVLFALGRGFETTLAGYSPHGMVADERAMRSGDVRALVRNDFDRAGRPRIVLTSFQTFNVLMPLYATERQVLAASSPPDLLAFSYGARDVVVVGQWDWGGWRHVRDVVRGLPARLPTVAPDGPDRVLVLAGGWESSLFAGAAEPDVARSVLDQARVRGTDALGRPVTRLMAFEIDVEALLRSSP